MTIALTGFMGCGKSSVGREIARLLSCPFTDLDEYIAEKEGKSISMIFSMHGEDYFRKSERECLQEILSGTGSRQLQSRTEVLALGGGTAMMPENREVLKETAICIYLKSDACTLVSHLKGNVDSRPLLKGHSGSLTSLEKRISMLLSEREEAYAGSAALTVGTDGKSVQEIAEEICAILKEGGMI